MNAIDNRKPVAFGIIVGLTLTWLIGLSVQLWIEHRAVGKLIRDHETLNKNQIDLRKHQNQFVRDVAAWCNEGERRRNP